MSQLLDQLRGEIRTRHYSIRTEATYVDWTVRFIRHHGMRHPKDMGPTEVSAFLCNASGEDAASTQAKRSYPR
jgi:hypothetical protein